MVSSRRNNTTANYAVIREAKPILKFPDYSAELNMKLLSYKSGFDFSSIAVVLALDVTTTKNPGVCL